jgi:hypothetical protein
MDQSIERAARRVEWASRALDAASGDLRDAGERGLLVNGAASALQSEAARMGELAEQVAGLDTSVKD